MKYNKLSIIAVLAGFYLLPLLLMSAYGLQVAPGVKNWTVFAAGLFFALSGTAILFALMSQWEIALKDNYKNSMKTLHTMDAKRTVSNDVQEDLSRSIELQELLQKLQTAQRELQSEHEILLEQMNEKDEELQNAKQDYERYRIESEGAKESHILSKNTTSELLQQRDEAIKYLQTTASQQKTAIENLQQQVLDLQNKEEELNYEIKTLLYVSRIDSLEKEPSYQLYASSSIVDEDDEEKIEETEQESVESEAVFEQHYQADDLVDDVGDGPGNILKQCLEMAAKMNGVGSARNSSLPVENYVLDMRRLCDHLRIETQHGVLLYSQKDSKLVFANSQVKDLLGWPSDKFIQIFPEIIQTGFTEWREGLHALANSAKTSMQVAMKSKEGRSVKLNCHLGTIENGIFRNHVIAILSK